MNQYEVLYIIDPTLEEEATKAVIERFNKLIADNGAKVTDIDEWGKRRLAYEINGLNEGYYVLLHMEAAPEFPSELERNFQISENIMRYLVTRVGE